MFLNKAYGRGVMTGACALLMYFSMVINESLVARTFGTYTLQLFDLDKKQLARSRLGVGLLLFAGFVNALSNQFIQTFSFVMAFVKIAGLAVLAAGGLWASGLSFESISAVPEQSDPGSFLGAIALAILAYKGFTTITNSGGENQKSSSKRRSSDRDLDHTMHRSLSVGDFRRGRESLH